jgi:hypothetical protein
MDWDSQMSCILIQDVSRMEAGVDEQILVPSLKVGNVVVTDNLGSIKTP